MESKSPSAGKRGAKANSRGRIFYGPNSSALWTFFFFLIFIYKAQFSTNSIYNAVVITLLYLHNHSY